jgi:hypothetical protein
MSLPATVGGAALVQLAVPQAVSSTLPVTTFSSCALAWTCGRRWRAPSAG